MFGANHYVPVLRGKQGEFWSLRDSQGWSVPGSEFEILDRLTPLLEVAEVPWDYEKERPAKTIDEHLGRVPENLEDCWGTARPIFLDLYLIPDHERMASGEHPIAHVFEEGRIRGLQLIPVTGRDRNNEARQAAIEQANKDQRGLCLRLTDEDLGDPQELRRFFDGVLADLEGRPGDVDIVLDFGPVSPDAANTFKVAVESTIRTLAYVEEWRSLIFAATAFPENMSPFSADSVNLRERTEWNIWRDLRESDDLPRTPTFGDYVINHPAVPDVDPRFMRMSANLRYTADEDWIILKGRNVRRHGFEQFNELCKKLVRREEFRGEDFSWGDDYIARCARDEEGPGNATSWRRVGTTHHLAVVVDQMTSLP